MDKVIKLKMDSNKNIIIYCNEQEKIKIAENDRSISAKRLFSLFDKTVGCNFKVEKENENDLDDNVLTFFAELISNIAKKVNEIAIDASEPKT